MVSTTLLWMKRLVLVVRVVMVLKVSWLLLEPNA